jgi:hypothetical protein
MSWRNWAARIVLICGIGVWTQAACAELTDLPHDQKKMATCMLSVLRTVRGVTESRLRVSKSPTIPLHTYLEYNYHSRTTNADGPAQVEITDLLSNPTKTIMLRGLLAPGGNVARQLNDENAGMIDIVNGWNKACGLDLVTIFE